jgi:hypothetical protein
MTELNKVSREELEAVFEEWLLILDRSINTKGDHIDETEPNGFIRSSRGARGSSMLKFSGCPIEDVLGQTIAFCSQSLVWSVRLEPVCRGPYFSTPMINLSVIDYQVLRHKSNDQIQAKFSLI